MSSPEGAAWRQSLSREPLDPLDLLGIDRDDHFMGRFVGMVRDQKVMIEWCGRLRDGLSLNLIAIERQMRIAGVRPLPFRRRVTVDVLERMARRRRADRLGRGRLAQKSVAPSFMASTARSIVAGVTITTATAAFRSRRRRNASGRRCPAGADQQHSIPTRPSPYVVAVCHWRCVSLVAALFEGVRINWRTGSSSSTINARDGMGSSLDASPRPGDRQRESEGRASGSDWTVICPPCAWTMRCEMAIRIPPVVAPGTWTSDRRCRQCAVRMRPVSATVKVTYRQLARSRRARPTASPRCRW